MKTIVYIDGQNFLYKVAEILKDHNVISGKQELNAINIRAVFERLFPKIDLEIRFFGVAKIRHRPDFGPEILEKSKIFSDNLRKIRNNLVKQNIDYVEVGNLKIRDSDICKTCGSKDYRYQEKGVDVGLAVSLVEDALMDVVDNIILASSDTDMVPAVLCAEKAGKKVTYVGFDGKMTRALINKSNSSKAIKDKDVIEAYIGGMNKNA